ncbi:hypothetical protein [Polaromonas sp. C04]|uniref:hypothetical protein n=1 Tax=Polaromonas sp. C04 TaxID=1945857 RepID=UPI0025702840|nr:hypothetical protein [Polaromonas sp. C04]
MLRPPGAAIPDSDLDAGITLPGQSLPRLRSQLFNELLAKIDFAAISASMDWRRSWKSGSVMVASGEAALTG